MEMARGCTSFAVPAAGTTERARRGPGTRLCGRRRAGRVRRGASLRASIAPPGRAAAGVTKAPGDDGSVFHSAPAPAAGDRSAEVVRSTRETSVKVFVNLDGTGYCEVSTGVPFLDHMLGQLSAHGLLDLAVAAEGDTWIDDHHTNEDVGIALGVAIARALGDKRGIRRFGHFAAPLDEALVDVVLDFSGRAHLSYDMTIPTEKVGRFDTQLVKEFYAAVAGNAQMTLHVRQIAGENSHHIIEASFKAFARAMKMALEIDPRRGGTVPSSKGTLTDGQALEGKF